MEVSEAIRKYNPQKPYTYADYASWDDDIRCELIDGEIIVMDAPSFEHQGILMELSRQLANFLVGKQCRVFAAPCDVCLNGKGDEDDTVVQPDIVVICDELKLIDKKKCNGAPDMAIEVLSPSTLRYDRIRKLDKYLQTGVREYWIVDPVDKSVDVHILENDKYVITAYQRNEAISVHVLDGCIIELQMVFSTDYD